MISRGLVKETVVTAPRGNTDLLFAHHVVEFIRIDSCRIDHIFRLEFSLTGGKLITAVDLYDVLNFRIKLKFYSVLAGVFRKSDIQIKRADDPRRGSVQRRIHLIRDIRLHRPDLFSTHDLKSPHAVFYPSLVQFFQRRHILLTQADDQRTDPLKREIQIFGELLHHFISLYVQLCHERSRDRIISCMDDRAVGLGCPAADVLLFFQHTHADFIAGQFPCRSRTGHSASDYDHIIHDNFLPSISAKIFHFSLPLPIHRHISRLYSSL